MVGQSTILSGRIRSLEKAEARKAAHVAEPLSQHFRVAVSCPPDASFHVRGGNAWESNYWIGIGNGYYIGSFSIDFSDADTIENYDGNFTNADYYIGIIAVRAFYGLEDRQAIGGGVEYATAAEAESYIENVVLPTMTPWRGHDFAGALPLWGVVLRNNGVTDTDGQVLPIDRVNRGRSYIWQDVRPRHYVDGTL